MLTKKKIRISHKKESKIDRICENKLVSVFLVNYSGIDQYSFDD